MMNKKIMILILCLAVMVVVSGCWRKEKKQPIIVNNEQKIEEIEQEKAEKIGTSTEKSSPTEAINNNINNWQIFKEQNVNFTFEYPKKWTYSIKKYEFGTKRIIFSSEIRDNEIIVEMPIPAVGLETWEPIEKKIYQTNDANTDLLLTYMESRYEDKKLLFDILKWQEGIKGDELQKGFKEWDDESVWLYIVRYDEKYDKYYRSIIEKIANSIKFILQ
ncbi:hypothetical protein KAI65_00840 [Candidatus Parcubacteria bacterium]|nr:hypothetical protein [Candidatus Parcubacteria bacterium]